MAANDHAVQTQHVHKRSINPWKGYLGFSEFRKQQIRVSYQSVKGANNNNKFKVKMLRMKWHAKPHWHVFDSICFCSFIHIFYFFKKDNLKDLNTKLRTEVEF